MLNERDFDIIKALGEGQVKTLGQLASQLQVSAKTISISLKRIQSSLEAIGLRMVRKPGVGVHIEGDLSKLGMMLQNHPVSTIETREDRIKYICLTILSSGDGWTLQALADEVYVSLTTLEKDFLVVRQILQEQNIQIEQVRGKGSRIIADEVTRREAILKLLLQFWDLNWQIITHQGQMSLRVSGLPEYIESFLETNLIMPLSQLIQGVKDQDYHILLLKLMIALNRMRDGHLVEVSSGMIQELPYSEMEELILTEIPDNERIYLSNCLPTSYSIDPSLNQVIVEVVQDLIEVEDKRILQGFIHHISEMVKRVKNHDYVTNPFAKDVKRAYPHSYDRAVNLKQTLEYHLQIEIPEDEIAYLAVYIQMFKEQLHNELQYEALLVCNTGKGTSQLMAAKLRREVPNIHVSRILSIPELMETSITEDLILSTVDVQVPGLNVVKVSPLLDDLDIEKIKGRLQKKEKISLQDNRDVFAKLIHSDMILLDESYSSMNELIDRVSQHLIQQDYVEKGYAQSVKEREAISSTSFGSIATPHSETKYVKRSVIVVVRLKHELQWGQEKVRFVFFLCVKDQSVNELEMIYDKLLALIEKMNTKGVLEGTKEEIKEFLEG